MTYTPQLQLQPTGFGYGQSEGYEITPELFEAVSSLEPITVRVGALEDHSG
jgi:hypothetical protein